MKQYCVICGNPIPEEVVETLSKEMPNTDPDDLPWMCSLKCVLIYEKRFNVKLRSQGK